MLGLMASGVEFDKMDGAALGAALARAKAAASEEEFLRASGVNPNQLPSGKIIGKA